MRIIKKDNSIVTFEEVENGRVFFTDGNFYLKMDNLYYEDFDNQRAINVVNLESGKPTYFGQDKNVVVKKDAELLVY